MNRKSAGRPRGSIVQKGRNTWLVRVSIGQDSSGKRLRHNETVHGTRADAQKALTQLQRQLDDGVYVARSRQSFGDWLKEWLDVLCAEPSERTRTDYANNIRRYVPDSLKAKELTSVQSADIQRLLNELGKRLAPRTVRYLHAVLRRSLNVAVSSGKVARNVATLARPPRQSPREMRALDPDQVRRLIAAAAGTRYEALWLLLVTTGLRPSEAFALKWSDLNESSLSIQRALVRPSGGSWRFEEPKTARSRRIVVVPPSVLAVLHQHRRRQLEERMLLGPDYVDYGLMFATEAGAPLHLNNLTVRHFKPLLRNAGLSDIRMYDLRHTAATLLLIQGENPKVVSEMLGHSTIVLTLDTYTHVLPGMQAAAAAKLEVLFARG